MAGRSRHRLESRRSAPGRWGGPCPRPIPPSAPLPQAIKGPPYGRVVVTLGAVFDVRSECRPLDPRKSFENNYLQEDFSCQSPQLPLASKAAFIYGRGRPALPFTFRGNCGPRVLDRPGEGTALPSRP